MSINSAFNTNLNDFVIKEPGGRVNIFKQILLTKNLQYYMSVMHIYNARIDIISLTQIRVKPKRLETVMYAASRYIHRILW